MAKSINQLWLKLYLVHRSIGHHLPFIQNLVTVVSKFAGFCIKFLFPTIIKEMQNILAVALVFLHAQMLVVLPILLRLIVSLYFAHRITVTPMSLMYLHIMLWVAC